MKTLIHFNAKLQLLCLIFTISLGLTWPVPAATEFKIITLQHRLAEDILPAVIPLVGEDGTASAVQNNLIIRTSPSNMADIEQLISALDTARQNFKITVMRNKNSSITGSNAAVSGHTHAGNVSITSGTRRVIRNGVAVNIENQQHRSNSSSTQFIQVADGDRGFISVGQSVPYTQEWINLTQRYASVQRITEFINIDTGFAVRPRVLGNKITLEITPRFSQLNQRGMIDFESLATTITTSRGEWIDIAGIMQQKDEVSSAILSWGTQNRSSNTQLLIKVE